MPIEYFNCPNTGKQIEVNDCLIHCDNRCAPARYLLEISVDRQPHLNDIGERVHSVTELEQGTRQSYLQIKEKYTINPLRDNFRAVLGTAFHTVVEKKLQRLFSKKYKICGLPDWYDLEKGELRDYKTSSKLVPQSRIADWAKQLNMYRLLILENYPTAHIDRLRIGLFMIDAKPHKGENIFKWIEIPIDETVLDYFITKNDALITALKDDKMPPRCTAEENWNGYKCRTYCPVAQFCPKE